MTYPPMPVPDPIAAAIAQAKVCQVHRTHRPEPRSLDAHHIQPRSEGGPTTPENLVVTCPTGHRNIHALLALYQHHGGWPPYHVLKRYAAGERHYAVLGWQRMRGGP
jgi:hypothetical protein